MSTNFPTSFDSYTDKIDNVSTVLATSVNNLQDAIAALQTKVGINDSTATSTMDYMTTPFFQENVRQMYFWMANPPVGWSTTGLATNCIVGIKGGIQAWNTTGGTEAGVWPCNDMEIESHNHRWRYYPGSGSQVFFWDSTGSTYVGFVHSGTQAPMANPVIRGLMTDYYYYGTNNDRGRMYFTDYYTSKTGHTHDFAGTWRPNSAVGILAKYTGA